MRNELNHDAEKEEVTDRLPQAAGGWPHGNGEMVLVVDDEASIRDFVKIVLERNGYRTIVARNGEKAIALFSARSTEFNALILGMTMPVMSGTETLRTIRRMSPQLPVLTISGSMDDAPSPTDEFTTFLRKPFGQPELLVALYALLRGARQGHARKRILLVDDDEHLCVTLSDYLTLEGFGVATASNGGEALREIEKAAPDVIILDIRMPGMGGIHFLRAVSRQDGTLRYPVLVHTAASAMEGFFGTIDVDGFLAKPCDEAELLVRINGILAKSAAKEERSRMSPRRVLIAENDPGVAVGLTRFFVEAGYEIEVADSGPETLERTIVGKPDVLVLKEVMPGMNGSVVAQMLMTMPKTSKIPIVVYDSTRTSDDERKFPHNLPDGIRAFLLTSDPAALCQAVREVLGP